MQNIQHSFCHPKLEKLLFQCMTSEGPLSRSFSPLAFSPRGLHAHIAVPSLGEVTVSVCVYLALAAAAAGTKNNVCECAMGKVAPEANLKTFISCDLDGDLRRRFEWDALSR